MGSPWALATSSPPSVATTPAVSVSRRRKPMRAACSGGCRSSSSLHSFSKAPGSRWLKLLVFSSSASDHSLSSTKPAGRGQSFRHHLAMWAKSVIAWASSVPDTATTRASGNCFMCRTTRRVTAAVWFLILCASLITKRSCLIPQGVSISARLACPSIWKDLIRRFVGMRQSFEYAGISISMLRFTRCAGINRIGCFANMTLGARKQMSSLPEPTPMGPRRPP